MHKTALALTSAALMFTATTAAAQEHEPPPLKACGSELTIELVKENSKRRDGETSFAVSGNVVLRISDEDSSVVVRLPGRVSGKATETGGIVTQTGRIMLFPDPELPFVAEAIARAGLPELPLIIGKVVIEDTFDPEIGEFIDSEILSVNGRVIDVCELLAR